MSSPCNLVVDGQPIAGQLANVKRSPRQRKVALKHAMIVPGASKGCSRIKMLAVLTIFTSCIQPIVIFWYIKYVLSTLYQYFGWPRANWELRKAWGRRKQPLEPRQQGIPNKEMMYVRCVPMAMSSPNLGLACRYRFSFSGPLGPGIYLYYIRHNICRVVCILQALM